jgi:hypothetical protein
LGAASAELQNLVAACCVTHARRFGGDQRLEIDDVEQRRFDKLALQHLALHAH